MRQFTKISLQTVLAVTLSLLILGSNVLMFFGYKRNREIIIESYINTVKDEFNIVMGIYSNLADFIYHSHINTPQVIQIFAKGVLAKSLEVKNYYRKQLYNHLYDIYQLLTQYNFRQLHFHEANNVSFLRFHAPEKFGDDLTGIRLTVEHVNRYKKPAIGFEEGRILNGYRYVYPLFWHNKHIGSVEISVSMKTFIETIKKLFNKDAEFIILKSETEKVFKSERSNYCKWPIDDDYMLDTAIYKECILKDKVSDTEFNNIKKIFNIKKSENSPFCIEITYNDKPYILAFLPINNFEGKKVAYIYELMDGRRIKRFDTAYYIILFLMCALFILVNAFIFYYRASHKKIVQLATLDSLTNIYNRRSIMGILESEFERFKRYKSPFSIILLDIDHFKTINDTYGHSIGDQVLVSIVEIIKSNIRKVDYIGRYGGEEFIVVLPETKIDGAIVVAEKLRKKVSEYEFPKVKSVTISLGVEEVTTQFETLDELIISVDKKLYQAKQSGRNQWVC